MTTGTDNAAHGGWVNAPQSNATAIALNRFGLGARPGDTPPASPRTWLLAQFDLYEPRPAAWASQPSSQALVADLDERRMAAKKADADDKQGARKSLRTDVRDTYLDAVTARVESALTTPAPFVERLVHFWANHFAVSADKPGVTALAGSFEAEAIRPHVLGRFEDMLVAVERHPAMQIFLDQARSIGPDSKAAERAAQRDPGHKRGLNENLAREIMELHTLGARTGYDQGDVTEFARALTGWSIATARGPQPNGAAPGTFVFRPAVHEPGVRTIMGRQYSQPGEQQALAVLHDLASSPATARHIALKLARHFVADDPPSHVTERLAQVYMQSGGELPQVYRALIEAPQSWFAAAGAQAAGLPAASSSATGWPATGSPATGSPAAGSLATGSLATGSLATGSLAAGSPAPGSTAAGWPTPGSSPATKFKTPWEWLISSMRGLGWQDTGKLRAAPLLAQLGQPVWRPGSPAGYDDIAASWAAPDALVRRVDMAQRLAAHTGDRVDPSALARTLLAGSVSPATAAAVARAESVQTAIALLLVSPDFLRR
jgi:uncharacterized protein (DUF1800 family)